MFWKRSTSLTFWARAASGNCKDNQNLLNNLATPRILLIRESNYSRKKYFWKQKENSLGWIETTFNEIFRVSARSGKLDHKQFWKWCWVMAKKTIGFQFCGRQMLPIGNFRKLNLAKFSNSKMSQKGHNVSWRHSVVFGGSQFQTNSDQQLGSENSQVLNRFRSSIRYFDVNFTFLKIFRSQNLWRSILLIKTNSRNFSVC